MKCCFSEHSYLRNPSICLKSSSYRSLPAAARCRQVCGGKGGCWLGSRNPPVQLRNLPEPAGTFRNPPQGAAGSLRLLQGGEVVCPSSPTDHPGRGLPRSWRLPAEPAPGQQQGAERSVQRLLRTGTAREAEH